MGNEGAKLAELKIADHIFAKNPIDLYSHHGIVENVGDTATNTKVLHLHGETAADAYVKRSNLEEFLSGRDLHIITYPRRIPHENLGVIDWIFPDTVEADPEDVVLERSKKHLGEDKYDFLFYNCEHFAMYCKCGKKRSVQVEKFFEGIAKSIFSPKKKDNL